jgi:sialate O-acetylesterase
MKFSIPGSGWRFSVAIGLVFGSVAGPSNSVHAELKLPNIFSDHMVLQQGQENKIWGTAVPAEKISISIAGKTVETQADAKGSWSAKLPALSAANPPLKLTVKGSEPKTAPIDIVDVLMGEVWICSGQSNMQWSMAQSNDADLERLASALPEVRMINFPQIGSQDPIWSHDDRKWAVSGPGTIDKFSAVGYFFARQIHQTTGVPIGMINNAWGGSAAEAWVNRDLMKSNSRFNGLLNRWVANEEKFAALSAKQDRSEAENKELEGLKNQMRGNARPGNIYNGVLKSHIGYGIKGAIWYQGESNAGRAYQYRELFPFMIQNWRREFGQGDFPFYWVQLADYQAEKAEPGDSDWAELREAQTMAMDALPNSGQAVIVDIGEGKDIHPKNKVDVGRRLARWALAKQYDQPIDYQSPRYESMEKAEGSIVLKFKHTGPGWRPFDVAELRGFTIAGDDKKFYNAEAKILKDNRIQVSSPSVPNPVSVRYAWAQNPICNVFSSNGLPLTPFRTDDWTGVTAGKE